MLNLQEQSVDGEYFRRLLGMIAPFCIKFIQN